MADTPVSVTKGPNGQEIETYQQWNVQDWFDTARWNLTGTQADSDFKAGLWWQDSQDLNNTVAPSMRTAAAQWDAQYAKLDAAKDKLTAARTKLANYTGQDATSLNQALDNLTQSLDQRAEATEPISAALRNSASVLETSHAGPMTTLWNKWENDLANAPVCKVDVEQMKPVISDMAQSVLDAANAVQKGYQTEIEPPEVATPQPGRQLAGDDHGRERHLGRVGAGNGRHAQFDRHPRGQFDRSEPDRAEPDRPECGQCGHRHRRRHRCARGQQPDPGRHRGECHCAHRAGVRARSSDGRRWRGHPSTGGVARRRLRRRGRWRPGRGRLRSLRGGRGRNQPGDPARRGRAQAARRRRLPRRRRGRRYPR